MDKPAGCCEGSLFHMYCRLRQLLRRIIVLMEILAKLLLGIYVLASFLLIVISLNCYVMVYLFRRKQNSSRKKAEEFQQEFSDSGRE